MPIDPDNIVPLEPRVIEIHPDAKYLIMLPEGMPEEEQIELADLVGDWWNENDMPFLLVPFEMNLKLVRVDEEEPSKGDQVLMDYLRTGEPNIKPEKALEDEV